MTTATPSVPPDLLRQALALPDAERAELAEHLLDSLPTDATLSREWRDEIAARLAAFERGEMAAADWRESLARVEARLRERHP